jgi:hypothetical protein
MQENYLNQKANNADEEIDLRELYYVLIKGRWIIFSVTSFISIITLIYSLYLPNIYQSKTLLAPVDSSNNISGALKGYSSIASMAGISLPSGGGAGNSVKALKKLKTLSFFENKIMPNIFLPDLMAIKSWDNKTNTLIYDESIYKQTSDTWISNANSNKPKPSAQQSFNVFRGLINISEDSNTSFVTLAIKHESPFVAKEWTQLIVREINAFYREKDKLESQKAISYLNAQIAMTNLSEIKQVIAELIQQETQKLTLIEANQFYVFDYIDPPAVMEQKSEPSRSLICILGSLLGVILSIFIVLIRHYIYIKKT